MDMEEISIDQNPMKPVPLQQQQVVTDGETAGRMQEVKGWISSSVQKLLNEMPMGQGEKKTDTKEKLPA